MPAYQSYFDNFFTVLPLSRVNFKQLGTSTLTTLREAALGKEFGAHEADLVAALAGFDVNLIEVAESTSGDTATLHAARKQWLAFADDTMKDLVTPKLRKVPVYADFKKHQKSRLAVLPYAELLQQAKQLLALYEQYAADLQHPGLLTDAQAVYAQLVAAHQERGTSDAAIQSARVALTADWLRLARALRRLKAQLELRFEEPAEVYRFFDFGSTRTAKRPGKVKSTT